MAKIKRFEDLEIWKTARDVFNDIWELIQNTPLQKDYKLKEQINGSCCSIMDNIAEGFERDGNKEFLYFLSSAKASCGETRSQLYRCLEREHIDKATPKIIYDKVVLNSKKKI
jgi:four helix bundle protein